MVDLDTNSIAAFRQPISVLEVYVAHSHGRCLEGTQIFRCYCPNGPADGPKIVEYVRSRCHSAVPVGRAAANDFAARLVLNGYASNR